MKASMLEGLVILHLLQIVHADRDHPERIIMDMNATKIKGLVPREPTGLGEGG